MKSTATFTAKTKQIGNELVIIIPQDICEQLDLKPGEEVILQIKKR